MTDKTDTSADDEVKDALEAYAACEDAESDNFKNGEDDIRFARLGEQWPDSVKAQRLREGRPCLTINKLPVFIRQVVNDARQNKPAIKVQPQDSKADPETADIMSGLIRSIETGSDAEVAYDTAVESAATNGFGYFRVNLKYACDDNWDQDIVIERVANPFTIHGDPYSTAADSSDWNVAFATEMVPKKLFEATYKDAAAIDWTGRDEMPAGWREGGTVRVAEYWRREKVSRKIVLLSNGEVVDLKAFEADKELFQAAGVEVVGSPRDVPSYKVSQTLMTGKEVLSRLDWAGKYIPIIPVYGDEVNLNGKRHFRSMIRSAKDAQLMFNYWRTVSTELVALAPKAPFIGPKGAFETDRDKWETVNNESHAFIEFDGKEPPQRQPFSGVPAGALQEALNASDDMKAIIGLYDASLGARSNETSGVAINARQREGDVATFHFIDNLSRGIRHGGRVIIDLIPSVYTPGRIVRILGQDGVAKSAQLGPNQPGQSPTNGDERIYDLTAGKYDLTVSAGPSFTTRREEAAEQMTELIRAYPAAAPVLGDLLAKNLDWPGADEIAERLKALLPAQLQGQDGIPPEALAMHQQVVQQAQQATEQAQQLAQQNQALQQQLQAAQQDRSAEQAKLQIDQYRAETERMKVQHEIEQPSVLPKQPAFEQA